MSNRDKPCTVCGSKPRELGIALSALIEIHKIAVKNIEEYGPTIGMDKILHCVRATRKEKDDAVKDAG